MKIFSLAKNLQMFIRNSKQALIISPPVSQTLLKHRNIEGIRIPIYQDQQPTNFEQTDRYCTKQFDDTRPENHIKINLIQQDIQTPQLIQEAKNAYIPFILEPFQKAPEKQYIFRTFRLQTSIKKSVPLLKKLSGCQIFEAMQILRESPTKVARFLLQELNTNGRIFLEDKGFNLKRVYIIGVLTHRVSRLKKINYHAKGKFGIRKRDYCKFTFIFSEKPMKEFYKQLIQGKTPAMLSYLLKQHLINTNAEFKEVKKIQLLLDQKGKYIQKIQFNRRCIQKYQEFQLKGYTVPLDTIKEYLLEKEAEEFDKKYGYLVNIDIKKDKDRIETRKELLKNAKL